MDIDYKAFLSLLSAKNKAQVKTILRLAARTPRPRVLNEIQEELEITDKDFNTLLENLTKLEMLFMRGQNLEFPPDFHGNLKSLIETCLEELSAILVRESPQPSLPKYEGLDWRIDIRAGNSSVEKAAKMPKAVLELKIQGKKEVVELSKERVQGLLDVLGKVKEQLDALADN
jgi:DNA-directed RNA polymerase subunit F